MKTIDTDKVPDLEALCKELEQKDAEVASLSLAILRARENHLHTTVNVMHTAKKK